MVKGSSAQKEGSQQKEHGMSLQVKSLGAAGSTATAGGATLRDAEGPDGSLLRE